MASPASFLKHPIHPMLIPFPIALWIFSFLCDVIHALGWGGPLWSEMAFYSMAAGLVGALMAAVPGYIDFRSIIDPAIRRVARTHMLLNLSIVVLFGVNLWLRTGETAATTIPLILSFIGIAMLGISGWLGGELVYVHGVAVEGQGTLGSDKRDRGRLG
jgi:uncharacterized membrane protein